MDVPTLGQHDVRQEREGFSLSAVPPRLCTKFGFVAKFAHSRLRLNPRLFECPRQDADLDKVPGSIYVQLSDGPPCVRKLYKVEFTG